jgi:GNAT superfamily N-acetyltransferase
VPLPPDLKLRPAVPGDAGAIARLVTRCDETYRAWAPRGWEPPEPQRERSKWADRLRDPQYWVRVTIEPVGALVGLVCWRPERASGDWGDAVPGVGYVSYVHVDPERWREGIAGSLLELAEEAMRGAGYERALLWTFEAAPARHLYERRGWRPDSRRRWEAEMRLPMVGYEKSLGNAQLP